MNDKIIDKVIITHSQFPFPGGPSADDFPFAYFF
jgi:hypothetical protein